MKRLFSILAITGLMTFGNVQAQDSTQAAAPATEQVADTTAAEATTDEATATTDEAVAEEVTFTQGMKKRFIEGGPGFMGIVLICLILGLAIAIERIWDLKRKGFTTQQSLKIIIIILTIAVIVYRLKI